MSALAHSRAWKWSRIQKIVTKQSPATGCGKIYTTKHVVAGDGCDERERERPNSGSLAWLIGIQVGFCPTYNCNGWIERKLGVAIPAPGNMTIHFKRDNL